MKLKQNAAVLSVALALAAASVTQATPMLSITDGVAAPITISDNLAGDANPLAGAVSFTGVINGWNILVSFDVTQSRLDLASDTQLIGWWCESHNLFQRQRVQPRDSQELRDRHRRHGGS